MKMMIVVYEKCKYNPDSRTENIVVYDNVEKYEVISDAAAAAKIEAHTDGSCIDDYHEYLNLYFDNGEVSTYRNSYVDLFRV